MVAFEGEVMRVNVGRVDAWIRGTLAVVFLVLAAVFSASPVLSLAAALFALLFGATALTHSCPLYDVFGLDTRAHDSHAQRQ